MRFTSALMTDPLTFGCGDPSESRRAMRGRRADGRGRRVLVGAILVLLAGCAPTSNGDGRPDVITFGSHGVTYLVTEADHGRRITLEIGDTLRVRLAGLGADRRWRGAQDPVGHGVHRVRAHIDVDGLEMDFHAVDATRYPLSGTWRSDDRCEHLTVPCTPPDVREFMIETEVLDQNSVRFPPTSAASPTPSPPPAQHTLTLADNGRRISMRAGERLQVKFDHDDDPRWAGARAGNPTGLFRDSMTEGSSPGMTADFIAVAPAGTSVESRSDYLCFHVDSVCQRPPDDWIAYVDITADSPSPQPTPCEGPIGFGMAVTHPVITAGNTPRLNGVASSVTGTSPNCSRAGGTVTLFERRYGESAYREIATAETDANNEFSFTVRPLIQTSYQAWFRGQTSNAATVIVRVHRRMDFTSTGPTFAGRLTPAEAPIPVGLAYIDATGRYRYLGQTVSDTAGNFSITARLPRGTFTYVVYTSPRQGLLRGTRSIRFAS